MLHGSYYLKIGVSNDNYINSFFKGKADGEKVKGLLSRELHFGLNALVGVYAHIPPQEVAYSYYENNERIERNEQVAYEEHLDYSRLGFELNFHWKNYFEQSVVYKYGFAVGMMPGYRDRGRWATGLLLNVNLAFGLGRILKEE